MKNKFNKIILCKESIDNLKNYNEEKDIELKIECIKNEIIEIKNESFFLEENDIANAYFEIQAGVGGLDAQDCANILLKMYTSWFTKKNYNYEIIDLTNGDINGIKSISIKVLGTYAYGWLKHEIGVHRFVRKSPFDSSGKRHTSFVSIFAYPEIKNFHSIEIKENEIKVDTFRSGGAGGQHVNKTDSAIRITHIPTGLVVQSQSERSQHKNKINAVNQLKFKLNALYELNKNIIEKKIEETKSSITWGNQIRSYVFDKSYVKDLKTNLEYKNLDFILEGNLDNFVLSILKF